MLITHSINRFIAAVAIALLATTLTLQSLVSFSHASLTTRPHNINSHSSSTSPSPSQPLSTSNWIQWLSRKTRHSFSTSTLPEDTLTNVYQWGAMWSDHSSSPSSPSPVEILTVPTNVKLDNKEDESQSISPWKQISSSGTHTLLLSHNGQVHVIGSNAHGQLGIDRTKYPYVHTRSDNRHDTTSLSNNNRDNDGEPVFGPILIESLLKWNIVQVQAGGNHSMALSSDGELFMFGSNEWGQLGLDSKEMLIAEPTLLNPKSLYYDNTNDTIVVQIAAGDGHTVVLTKSNKMWAWGHNSDEQVGLSHEKSRIQKPMRVNMYSITSKSYVVQSVGATRANSYCLTTTGEMFVWGDGTKSQFASGKMYRPISYGTPMQIVNYLNPNQQKAMVFSAGGDSFMAVTKYNETTINLIAWGANLYCNDMYDDVVIPYPRVIATLSLDDYFQKISIASSHALLVSNKNELFVCGNNTNGQLGVGYLSISKNLTRVATPSDALSFLDVGATDSGSYALLNYHCDNRHNCFNERGVCVSQDKCKCRNGFGGLECELFVCFGKESDMKDVCSGQGICTAPNTCECKPGFYGGSCEKIYTCHNRQATHPQVCSGNGKCVSNDVCKCSLTYYGKNCEHSVLSDAFKKRVVTVLVLMLVLLTLVAIVGGVVLLIVKRRNNVVTQGTDERWPSSINDESSEDSDIPAQTLPQSNKMKKRKQK